MASEQQLKSSIASLIDCLNHLNSIAQEYANQQQPKIKEILQANLQNVISQANQNLNVLTTFINEAPKSTNGETKYER